MKTVWCQEWCLPPSKGSFWSPALPNASGSIFWIICDKCHISYRGLCRYQTVIVSSHRPSVINMWSNLSILCTLRVRMRFFIDLVGPNYHLGLVTDVPDINFTHITDQRRDQKYQDRSTEARGWFGVDSEHRESLQLSTGRPFVISGTGVPSVAVPWRIDEWSYDLYFYFGDYIHPKASISGENTKRMQGLTRLGALACYSLFVTDIMDRQLKLEAPYRPSVLASRLSTHILAPYTM